MAYQKVCKQGRDDIKVKVNIQKPYPCIFSTLQLLLYIYLSLRKAFHCLSSIITTLELEALTVSLVCPLSGTLTALYY